MNKNTLSIGIILLFIISSINPMVIGNNNIVSEEDELLDNLAFMYNNQYGNSRTYEYFEERLLNNNSDRNIVEPDEEIIFTEIQSSSISIGPMDSPWPMKCYDLKHKSQSPYNTSNVTSLEKWRFACDWVEESAVIDNDGVLYFGTWGWYIHALYPNGTEKWNYHTGNIITSAPAIAEDGTIYIGSWDTKVYAFNPDGSLKWKTVGTGGSISSSPAIGNDGTIYIDNLGNKIVAIHSNGTIKWTYNTGYKMSSDPAIGDDGTIYVGSGDKYLYAMNPDGTVKWRFKTGDEVHSHPSIGSDGTIYFGSNDKKIYALYPNGTLKWKFSISSGLYNSVAIGKDGILYVADDFLYAIYPNGTLKWKFEYSNQRVTMSSPAISDDGTIYVGTWIGYGDGGRIIAINPDGTERWNKKIADEWVESSPCIGSDGTVYIGSSSAGPGYLHAFGPVESNSPPETPIISGKANGKVGENLEYMFRALDPDNNPVKFSIEWGDGASTGWIKESASNEKRYESHKYSTIGNYTIKAKAKDTLEEESGWGTFNVTIIKKSKDITTFLFLRFLEKYPILQRFFIFLGNC